MENAMCRQVWKSGVTCRDDCGLCRGDHIRCREAAVPALARPPCPSVEPDGFPAVPVGLGPYNSQATGTLREAQS